MTAAAAAMATATAPKLAPRGSVRPLQSRTSLAPQIKAPATGPLREVFGFASAGSIADPSIGYPAWNFSALSTVAYFGLTVNADGSLNQGDTGWSVWHSSAASGLVNTAHSNGVRVVVSLIAHQQASLCSTLSPASQQLTVAQTVAQLMGADGVNIDYEGSNQNCSDGVSLRTRVVQLAQAFRAAAGAGYLSIDTYAGSAEDPGGFFDIPNLATTVDSIFVMAYGLETANGPCATCIGATSPLGNGPQNAYPWNDERVAADYTPWASKAILGLPYYGVKACTTSTAPNAPGVSGTWGADAYTTITTYPSDPNISGWTPSRDALDPDGQEPWASFYSGYTKCTREEYWDDALSLGHKYDLVLRAGLRGAGIFTLDYGGGSPELWNQLQLHFSTLPTMPASVTACASQNAALVSWAPAVSSAGPVTGYVVTSSPGGQSASVPGGVTEVTVGGLSAGTGYTFSVTASNALGSGAPSPASNSVMPLTLGPAGITYFNWFDKASPGMLNDNIHLVNPSVSGTDSSGCVVVPGVAVTQFDVGLQSQTFVSLPQGTIGGPVRVIANTGPQVLASQRVQYFQSFNETPARGGNDASKELWMAWYDRASPGMFNDNFHLLNPGTVTASVRITGPGPDLLFQIPPGEEVFEAWPQGTIGGPVHITSDQPVLASQRVQYFQTFNESAARAFADAQTLAFFNWYDRASPGMWNDNLHIVNPGPSVATVFPSIGGRQFPALQVPAGQEIITGFPSGTIGGPVRISSDMPILATQRVQYYNSFNESSASSGGQVSLWFPWYDRASPGMWNDNIHILNPGPNPASVAITGPGPALSLTVAPGQEIVSAWPLGTIGGPVHLTADQPVLASQRVQYFQTFNEAIALTG